MQKYDKKQYATNSETNKNCLKANFIIFYHYICIHNNKNSILYVHTERMVDALRRKRPH